MRKTWMILTGHLILAMACTESTQSTQDSVREDTLYEAPADQKEL